jgi:hypothetical protein
LILAVGSILGMSAVVGLVSKYKKWKTHSSFNAEFVLHSIELFQSAKFKKVILLERSCLGAPFNWILPNIIGP